MNYPRFVLVLALLLFGVYIYALITYGSTPSSDVPYWVRLILGV